MGKYIPAALIALILLIAVLAPYLVTDRTTHANEQFANCAFAPVGFTTTIAKFTEKSTGNIIDQIAIRNVKRTSISSFEVIEELPEKIHYDGWDEKRTIAFEGEVDITLSQKRYWLGADSFGRSLYSRLLLGVRISLFVGIFSVVLSGLIGVLLGSIAAWGGKRVDNLVMFIINVVWSIPTLLLVFVVLIAVGQGLWNVVIAIGLTMWVEIARVVRGQIFSVKNDNYVAYTKTAGFSAGRSLIKHVLPNIMGPLLVMLTANFALAILLEAGLSFLGFGVQPPAPSLGNILSENYGVAISGDIAIALIPALFIMLIVFAFNILGNQLRDKYDVRM